MVGEIITWKLNLKALLLYKHRRHGTLYDRFIIKQGYLLYFDDERYRCILVNERLIRW